MRRVLKWIWEYRPKRQRFMRTPLASKLSLSLFLSVYISRAFPWTTISKASSSLLLYILILVFTLCTYSELCIVNIRWLLSVRHVFMCRVHVRLCIWMYTYIRRLYFRFIIKIIYIYVRWAISWWQQWVVYGGCRERTHSAMQRQAVTVSLHSIV